MERGKEILDRGERETVNENCGLGGRVCPMAQKRRGTGTGERRLNH